MSIMRNVGVFVGSLRQGSYNRMTARTLAATAPNQLHLEIVEIGHLPLYNQDLDDQPPATWLHFRAKIRSLDAVLFVTPEYNRSLPGVLKNAIDVASRPYGQNSWDGKPGAVISVSPGAIGGFGANHHLRQSCVFLNIHMMPQPEAYIGGAANLFDKDGNLTNEDTRKFLKSFIEAFAAWIEKISPSR